MLFSLVHGKETVTHTPNADDFDQWKSRLSPTEVRAIFDQITCEIEIADGIAGTTPTYVPIPNWRMKAYIPILEKACAGNRDDAR